jgi:hypothetical protein
MKMSNEKWICPICGGTKFKIKRESNSMDGPGFRGWIIGYECENCSVFFGSPYKFNFVNVHEEEIIEASNEIFANVLMEEG